MARTKKVDLAAMNPEEKKLFLANLAEFEALVEKANRVRNLQQKFGKTVKAEGFKMSQFKLAVALKTPEGEAALKATIATDLRTAQYMGVDIGGQIGLFLEEPKVSATERAYAEGQTAAMENKAARPDDYSPETPEYKSYMEGYHSVSAERIKGGIGKLDAAKARANAGKPKGAKKDKKAKPAKPAKAPKPAKKGGGGAKPKKPAAAPKPKADAGPPAAISRADVSGGGDNVTHFQRKKAAGAA